MNESKKPYASVGGTELSLWDITKILLAKIHWLLLAGVVVAAGVYAVVTIFVTPTYESRVSFYVYNSADNSSQGTINNSDLQAAESLATTYSKILASNSVLDSVLSDLRAETSLSRKELSRMHQTLMNRRCRAEPTQAGWRRYISFPDGVHHSSIFCGTQCGDSANGKPRRFWSGCRHLPLMSYF